MRPAPSPQNEVFFDKNIQMQRVNDELLAQFNSFSDITHRNDPSYTKQQAWIYAGGTFNGLMHNVVADSRVHDGS
jgi:hypothetical protein